MLTPGHWLRDPLLDDNAFDSRMPELLRAASRVFWTPVSVGRRIGELFAGRGARRVLDAGSGPGKACILAATTAPETHFVGVEQRSGLVSVARELTAAAGLENVEFRCGDATTIKLAEFDGLYLFNPFAENMFVEKDRFDQSVELSERRAVTDILRIEIALARAAPGFFVLTYHGFGGRLTDDYDVVHTEPAGTDVLRLWCKTGRGATPGRYLVEIDDQIVALRVSSSGGKQ